MSLASSSSITRSCTLTMTYSPYYRPSPRERFGRLPRPPAWSISAQGITPYTQACPPQQTRVDVTGTKPVPVLESAPSASSTRAQNSRRWGRYGGDLTRPEAQFGWNCKYSEKGGTESGCSPGFLVFFWNGFIWSIAEGAKSFQDSRCPDVPTGERSASRTPFMEPSPFFVFLDFLVYFSCYWF